MDEKQQKYSSRKFGVGRTNAFDVFNIIFFIILSFIMVYPFWSVIMASVVYPHEFLTRAIILWPRNPHLNWYRHIFITDRFVRSFYITTLVTIISVIWTLSITSTCAYALTKKTLPGYRIFTWMITVTMFFGGGLIPYFILIRNLGLMNTIWPLAIGAMGAFNFLILRAFITQIPEGLEESATIDGANEVAIYFRIIIPMSMPVLAVITLWSAVGSWNSFFADMLYLPLRPDLQRLQVILRQMIVENMDNAAADVAYRQRFGADVVIWTQGIRMAAVVVVTAPILIVYPFLQKHFVKGIYLGSMKG